MNIGPFTAHEMRQQDAAAEQRLAASMRAEKAAHAIVCRLAADPNLDPAMANVLARQSGKSLKRRFTGESITGFGELA